MKKFRFVITLLLVVSLSIIAMVAPVDAEIINDGGGKYQGANVTEGKTNTGLYPEEEIKKDSPHIYDRYSLDSYGLVYIDDLISDDEIDCGVTSPGECIRKGVNWTLYSMTAGIWHLYMIIAKWLVAVVSWAFTMEVLDYMINAYSAALKGLQETLWNPFMYLMWSVAIAWMVYYWISGKMTRLWSTLINSLIIIAMSATIMVNLPSFLQSVSNASTQTSVFILSGLSGTAGGSNETSPKKEVDEHSSKDAMNELKDDLFNFCIIIPYKLVQFGSVPLSEMTLKGKDKPFWESVVSADDRDQMVKDFYEGASEQDKKKFEWFTHEKTFIRLTFTLITFLASLVALICFVMVAFYTIMWQLIALGRGLLAAVYLLISLWPEYGMKEAAQWGWSMIQAMFMKVFYTIILAVYINLVIALATQAEKDNIGMLSIWLIALAIFLGLHQALKELRQKLTYIPLGNGMYLDGATREGEELGNKVAGSALMVAGAATGAGALVGAGLAMQHGGLGAVGKQVGMGAISKTFSKTAPLRKKLIDNPLKKVPGVAGSLLKKGGQTVGKAANWVDDALLKGKVKSGIDKGKEISTNAINKASDFANKVTGLNKTSWRKIPKLPGDILRTADKQFIRHARSVDGIDLTTDAGRQEYMRIHPDKAEQIGKLTAYYTNPRRLAKELPTVLPAKNTEEYKELSVKYGAQTLNNWTEARLQQASAIKSHRQLPLKQRVNPIKAPRLNKDSIIVNFENIRNQSQPKIQFEMPSIDNGEYEKGTTR